MIIRPAPSEKYSLVPNDIVNDARMSIETRGMLVHILSKPKNWQVRPGPLARHLGKDKKPIGRTKLNRMIHEAITAGYIGRSEKQTHQDDGRFGGYVYFVGMPEDVESEIAKFNRDAAPCARNPHTDNPHTGKPHAGYPHAGNVSMSHKEQTLITTESKKPLPKPFPLEDADAQPSGQQWSEVGQAAINQGYRPVFVGSKPYELWQDFRGTDGMPPTVTETIDGRQREVVWLPSVYPPDRRGAA